ncbi:hypothetical protein [Mesorhizobium silamurunense]|uniref:hypothetical protein n=1 Tax=Mesorhizobium silamurunense TaxID=499528 RepID=UPI00177BA14E|nr:hypothetical protein [Mesorhizobium silamurunense]
MKTAKTTTSPKMTTRKKRPEPFLAAWKEGGATRAASPLFVGPEGLRAYIALLKRGDIGGSCGWACGCAWPSEAPAVAAALLSAVLVSPLGAAAAVPLGDVAAAGAVPFAGVAAAGAGDLAEAVAAGAAEAPPTIPPRMIVGACACLCPDFSGIAATFSSVTAGTGSSSAPDGVEASETLPGSIAASLTTDGVEVGTPGTTMDEACAKPVVAKSPIPTAPRAIPGKMRNGFPSAIASKQSIRITITPEPNNRKSAP